MFRIHVTDSINQIFDDEMVYITKNQSNHTKKIKSAIGLSLTIELEF